MPVAEQSPVNTLELDDPSKYYRLKGVPIIDSYRRTRTRVDATGRLVSYEDKIDPSELERICKNSTEREKIGELGLIRIGHTDDDSPETAQPPIAGYVKNYVVGRYNDRPTIHADLYFDMEDKSEKEIRSLIKQYPRRSVEIAGQNHPEGFIDSVAIINRLPARNLGILTHKHSNKLVITRFSCPSQEDAMAKEISDLKSIIQEALADALPAALADLGITKFSATVDTDEEAKEMVDRKIKAHKKSKKDKNKNGIADVDEPKKNKFSSHADDSDDDEIDDEEGEDEDIEDEEDEDEVSDSKPAAPSGKGKEVRRMRDDSARIQLSRMQARMDELEAANTALKGRLDSESDNARKAKMESIVIQLEAEGYELDRPTEVARFSALADDQIDAEVGRIKRFHRRSPVGQPFIPNVGGPIDRDDDQADVPTVSDSIVGSTTDIVRFAARPDVRDQLKGMGAAEKVMELNRLYREDKKSKKA